MTRQPVPPHTSPATSSQARGHCQHLRTLFNLVLAASGPATGRDERLCRGIAEERFNDGYDICEVHMASTLWKGEW